MKDKKSTVHLLRKTSELLSATNEHIALIKFAADIGLIYGQQVQVDLTGYGKLNFKDVTFAETGMGEVIANAQNSYTQTH